MNETSSTENIIKEFALEKAKLYADMLLNLSIEKTGGITWNIKQVNFSQEAPWEDPLCIDGGVTGIILYLIELFSITKDSKYFEAAIKGMNRIIEIDKEEDSHNYSFYKGKAGIIYALSKLYKISGNRIYLDRAIQLTELSINTFLLSEYIPDSLYSGRAGMLLALLHLFNVSQNNLVLKYMERYALTILNNAHMDEFGLYWRSNGELNIRPLCSFGNGAAGIGHVFSELGKYFGDEGYNWIAKQSFRYVDYCWNEELTNWPDFRRVILNKEDYLHYAKGYLNGRKSIFEIPKDNISWLDGTIGIALSILHYSRLNTLLLSDNLDVILKKLMKSILHGDIQSMNLYDGLPAMGWLFNEAFKATGNKEYLNIVNKMLQNILYDSDGTETILEGGLLRNDMLAKANFCLSITHSSISTDNNILLPSIQKDSFSHLLSNDLHLPLEKIQRTIVQKYFSRTILVAERVDSKALTGWFHDLSKECNSIVESFVAFITHRIKAVQEFGDTEQWEEIFGFEKLRTRLIYNSTNSLLLYVEKTLHYESCINDFNNKEDWLLEKKLKISDRVSLIPLKWDWTIRSDKNGNQIDLIENINKDPGNFGIILRTDHKEGVVETPIDMIGLILNRFIHCKKISEVLSEVTLYCQSQNEETLKPLILFSDSKSHEELIIRLPFVILYQIKQLVCDGILTVSNK